MGGRITVYLDQRPWELVVGSRVRDLIQLQPAELRQALADGRWIVVDARGNEVGDDGDLSDGQRFALRQRRGFM